MANELATVQHSCNGLLKFVLPKDMVTVDLELMTLTGVNTYKKDKNNLEKSFFPWSKENIPPPEFFGKVKETQKTGDSRIFEYFTESIPRAKL